MTAWRWTLGVVLLMALGPGRAPAVAADAETQARRSFERAEASFKAGLFAEALAEYKAGYDQLPLPGFLINIAQCQRRMGDLAQARTTYRKFIMVAPDSPYVDEVKALIVELDRLIETSEEGGSGAAAGQAGATSLSPPPVTNQTLPSAAPAAETVANPLVTAPLLPPAEPRGGTRWWLWGSIGVAVVAGAVVTAYALRSPETTTLHDGSLGTLRR
jgi:tetratricopeptide (TPR) repeat protein